MTKSAVFITVIVIVLAILALRGLVSRNSKDD